MTGPISTPHSTKVVCQKKVVRLVFESNHLLLISAENSYFCGCRISFCTRQFSNSATKITFSDGHAIS